MPYPQWLDGHFPTGPEEARGWKPIVSYKAMHQKVIVAAQTRIEGAWSAYCGPVPGMCHDDEYQLVLDTGDKMSKKVAEALFPEFEGVPYDR